MAILTCNIKRLKREYDKSEKWAKIGSVTIDTDKGTGAIYLNHQDEVWRIFPKNRKKEDD